MAYLRLGTASEYFILVAAAVARFAFASPDRNDGVHLAVHPQCGTLGGNFTDVNAGIDLSAIRTIVTFGVSNGSALLPPVVIPPDPHAGNRQTNGPVWIEDLARDINATLSDYAVNRRF
ncbi:uncharacterized protein STEHIDRAFT_50118 [Stereum hirsutum FP-91666 SS1]|uniref:uncharacterized protein n=1 Tax=Stereum hirsutum (strain FP-91666) TaxID=721885 RepID=UPI000440F65D|nr:uncharacterized protein STEHIDRAFT_50118 [Stereum hirsutum FP-91666 SS1]EIM90887.1 hypothetical protein STEHIDRAFT_50118 [Stereum hirsutum FP-91666 SS1]